MADQIPQSDKGLKGTASIRFSASATLTGFRPLPDDHPCYALIGLITSECARIEHFLDAAIFEFAGRLQPKLGACITGQMIGMYPRYQALHQLALECEAPKPIKSEIERLSLLANGVADRRNRAVHDAWVEDMFTHEPYQFRTRAKKKPEYGPQPVTIDNLTDDLATVRKHLERVMALRGRIWELYRPKP